MPLQKNDEVKCTDEKCGCSMKVTEAPAQPPKAEQAPRCCCGSEMKKQAA